MSTRLEQSVRSAGVRSFRGPALRVALTPKRLRTLAYICDVQQGTGYSPTISQLGDRFGINKGAAMRRVEALKALGMIEYNPTHQHRSLTITRAGRAALPKRNCPHCGGAL